MVKSIFKTIIIRVIYIFYNKEAVVFVFYMPGFKHMWPEKLPQ